MSAPNITSSRKRSRLLTRTRSLMPLLAVFMIVAHVSQAQTTGAVYGAFKNELTIPPGANPPATESSSATFFGGNVDPQASAPSDGTVKLVASSFGQMVSNTIPYPNFQQDAVDRASRMLYYEDADGTPEYERENAAFRYRTLIYGRENEDVLASFDAIEEHWGPAERTRAEEAARIVLDALKYDPTNTALQDAILDIKYDTVVAEKMLASEKIVAARSEALGPELGGTLPPLGNLSISNELAKLRESVPLYGEALKVYFDLFVDPLGVDTQRIDPSAPDKTPYGYYMFQKRVPQRSLYAGTFRDGTPHPLLEELALLDDDLSGGLSFAETGQAVTPITQEQFDALDTSNDDELQRGELESLKPVVASDSDPNAPELLFNGYKDAVLLFEIMRDRMRSLTDAARLHALRSNPGQGQELSDRDKARELIARGQQQGYNDGNVLLGIFPNLLNDAGSKDPQGQSGLEAAIAGWGSGLRELVGVQSFLDSNANPLGFDRDFLALLQLDSSTASSVHYSSYDKIEEDLGAANSPLTISLTKYDEAVGRYQTLRLNRDQISGELDDQKQRFDSRLAAIVGVPPETSGQPNPEYEAFSELVLDELSTHPKYKGGEIAIQVLNVQNAQKQIDLNGQQIKNLEQEVRIEIERRGKEQDVNGKIANTYVKYGDKYASLARSIAAINAVQAAASATSAGAGNWLFSLGASVAAAGVNAGIQGASELGKGLLNATRERLQAQEKAEVVQLQDEISAANSEARIQSLLLGMSTLAIESQQAAILLAAEMGKLQALLNEKDLLETQRMEAREGLSDRYFADPAHRFLLDRTIIEAGNAFAEAQRWMFYAARALEYKWNSPFQAAAPTGGIYNTDSIFALRNAQELEAMYQAMQTYDNTRNFGTRGGSSFTAWSLRDDVLGFRALDPVTNLPAKYPDPITGESVPYLTAFRSYLASLETLSPGQTETNSFVKRLIFSTNRTNVSGNFFSPARWNEKIRYIKVRIGYEGSPPSSDTVGVYLGMSGDAYLRNQTKGEDSDQVDRVAGEMTAYPAALWTTSVDITGALSWLKVDNPGFVIDAAVGTENNQAPADTYQRTEFVEFPAAVSQWTLDIPLRTQQNQLVLDTSKITDIQIFFYTRYYGNRLNP